MHLRLWRGTFIFLSSLASASAAAMAPVPSNAYRLPTCVAQAAADYSLPLRGLIALWLTEGGRVGTVSKNTNKTSDFGPMQVNTVWARRLARDFGVTEEHLTNDFCMSIRAGAYILRYEINMAGGDFWEGVGHYHSRTPKFKYPYIQRVYQNSLKF
ncbi:lytic transglycosylase domain-containing protein [Achromobacter insuavis]|uniref:lytic transglycosylase domain-containing protein n=1 Tax=Achromobacter insuavis TaxID=1287735 RepID=UPI001F1319E6|nr:lytic transglycosylase domain-containing protein [Achromobacter insuavis]